MYYSRMQNSIRKEGEIYSYVVLDSWQMQKHEVKTWLSICGISLRGYADGKAVKAVHSKVRSEE